MSFLTSWLFVWLSLTIGALLATWLWVAAQSPEKLARGYIAFRFKEQDLPAGPEYADLFADLADLAVSRARLMNMVERKGVRQLIHDESDAFLYIAEQWYCGNEFMVEGDAFRPVVSLLEKHSYARRR